MCLVYLFTTNDIMYSTLPDFEEQYYPPSLAPTARPGPPFSDSGPARLVDVRHDFSEPSLSVN